MERAEQILEKFNDTIKQRNDRIAQLQQEMDDLQKEIANMELQKPNFAENPVNIAGYIIQNYGCTSKAEMTSDGITFSVVADQKTNRLREVARHILQYCDDEDKKRPKI